MSLNEAVLMERQFVSDAVTRLPEKMQSAWADCSHTNRLTLWAGMSLILWKAEGQTCEEIASLQLQSIHVDVNAGVEALLSVKDKATGAISLLTVTHEPLPLYGGSVFIFLPGLDTVSRLPVFAGKPAVKKQSTVLCIVARTGTSHSVRAEGKTILSTKTTFLKYAGTYRNKK